MEKTNPVPVEEQLPKTPTHRLEMEGLIVGHWHSHNSKVRGNRGYVREIF